MNTPQMDSSPSDPSPFYAGGKIFDFTLGKAISKFDVSIYSRC